jgi:hypothetical protein
MAPPIARAPGAAARRAARRARLLIDGGELPLAAPARHARSIPLRDGRRLGWDDTGDPAGIPVLWFHGFGATRLVRHPDESIATARGIRLISVDRPGIGLSTRRPGRVVRDFADDIETLADRLGLATFAIVAWSGGGPYALACASAMPDRVRAVGLVSPAAPIAGRHVGPYRTPFWRVTAAAAAVAPWVIHAGMRKWAYDQRRDPAGHLDGAIATMPERDRVILSRPELRAMMLANTPEVYRQGAAGLGDEAVAIARPWGFDPSSVRAPVRIWHGEEDRAVPSAMGRYLVGRLPNVRATFLPGEAHHVFLERWDEILAEVVRLAREAPPEAGS